MENISNSSVVKKRQALYWRLMKAICDDKEDNDNFESLSKEIVEEADYPPLILNPQISIDHLIQRYPKLEKDFASILTETEDDAGAIDTPSLQRALIFSKLMLNVFGPNTNAPSISAGQYSQWIKDVERFEQAFGMQPGELRGQDKGANQAAISGGGVTPSAEEIEKGIAAAGKMPGKHEKDSSVEFDKELVEGIKAMEKELIKRMQLREILKDNKLANKLTPSMTLVEQLLRDKSNLSGTALKNAKRLIREFIRQVAEVLKTKVAQTTVGKIDYSVPPKKVFRNLDLKKTIWKNLVNWNSEEKKLYVDQLYYKHSSRKILPSRLIVVVDQSGSMVEAMVNCTILASIFAGLPKIEAHLVAYDTNAIDLTPWVHDPFEVLLRTDLGGGTDGTVAMVIAREKIRDPANTVIVWISDYYEWKEQEMFNSIKAVKDSGVKFIPIGSVNSSGYHSVNPWFKKRLKDIGCPVLSGDIKKLISELKQFLG